MGAEAEVTAATAAEEKREAEMVVAREVEVMVEAAAEVATADATEDLKEMVAPMGQSGTGSQLRT